MCGRSSPEQESTHGLRRGDPERACHRRDGPRQQSGRRGTRRRRDRRGGQHRCRRRRGRDRRERLHRHAGLHRPAHASRRAALLGRDGFPEQLARGHVRRDRHLRVRRRAVPARRRRVPAAQPRGRRGDPVREHVGSGAVLLVELVGVCRLPRAPAAHVERRCARAAFGAALLRDGRARPARRLPRPTIAR